jgi:hypothetical protein
MLTYVNNARGQYKNGILDTEGYISAIWQGIRDNAETVQVVETATKVFLELYKNNKFLPVRGVDVIRKAAFDQYGNPNSHGLWPWLEKGDNADVIKQAKDKSNKCVYSVPNTQFRSALYFVVLGLKIN